MKVMLLGATGLIGRHCLTQLLNRDQVQEVVAPTRRKLPLKDQRLSNVLVDFDRLDEYPELFAVDAILCCLGTTIKQAGSRENFRRVDYQYCLDAARLGRAHSARLFGLVSAVGASRRSVFFYSRVKGELEAQLRALEYPKLALFRPSLLLGERGEMRLAEMAGAHLAPWFNPLLQGPLSAYQAIPAEQVAQAMVNDCLVSLSRVESRALVEVYHHDQIVKLATQAETRQ